MRSHELETVGATFFSTWVRLDLQGFVHSNTGGLLVRIDESMREVQWTKEAAPLAAQPSKLQRAIRFAVVKLLVGFEAMVFPG